MREKKLTEMLFHFTSAHHILQKPRSTSGYRCTVRQTGWLLSSSQLCMSFGGIFVRTHSSPSLARFSTDNKSSLTALHEALDNLENMTEAILAAYTASLASGDFDRPEDLEYDFESVNDRLWAEKEASGRGNRAEWEREKKEKEERENEDKVKPKKEKVVKKAK